MSNTDKLNSIKVLLDEKNTNLVKLQVKYELLCEEIKTDLKTISDNNLLLLLNTKVKLLFADASAEAKATVITKLENTVTAALNAVYGPGHKFIIQLEERRNQYEADFYIEDQNTLIQLKKPFVGKGGGKVTIAAMALQLAIIEYAGITGPVLLDEITKFVDLEAVNNVAKLLKDYSTTNSRQVINVTHHEAVAEQADVTVSVKKNSKGVAEIRLI
jgi:DNA repair exonuclease SbcCD ATPase subunit